MRKYKMKTDLSKVMDDETNSVVYGDYLPSTIIRNEMISINDNKATIDLILWKKMTQKEESFFYNKVKSHKEVLNLSVKVPLEHYTIEVKLSDKK